MEELDNVITDVKKERERQNKKWGIQDRSAVEWIAILGEEFGEASKEAVDFYFANGESKDDVFMPPSEEIQAERLENLRTELIQVAAVAVQAVENIDRKTKIR